MFNVEQKQRFIDEYSTSEATRETCVYTFSRTEPYEIKYDKDVCEMNEKEITEVLFSITTLRYSGNPRFTVLRNYIKWCFENGISKTSSDIFESKAEADVKKKRINMVSSPLDLQKYLNRVFSSESEKSIDLIYRGFCWLGFLGFTQEEIIKIEKTDVDLSTMTVSYNGKEAEIIKEAQNTLSLCVKLDSFLVYHPNYPTPVSKLRFNSDQLLRKTKGNITVKDYMTHMSDVKKKIGESDFKKSLTFNNIHLSGIFYRMYQAEVEGFPPDFSAVVDEFMGDRQYAGKKKYKQASIQKMKRTEILNRYHAEYDDWKAAFNL